MAFVIKNTGFNDKMPFQMQFYDKNYILNSILPFKIACKILNVFVIKNVIFAISLTACLFLFEWRISLFEITHLVWSKQLS